MKHIKKGLIAFCTIKSTHRGGPTVIETITNNKVRVKKYTFQVSDTNLLGRIMRDDDIDWVLDHEMVKQVHVEFLSE